MAANFPRIYSMTTVGIKQHFDCDYLFHPLRTDFSGESGSGKSMVADMIQLVLVCTGAYRSATQSNSHREPKGMVLQPKGKQHGIGYVLINIEIYPGKYIAIGACLESAHNKVTPFMIQGGYDWEETLTPLTQPLRYRDLKPDDIIKPINDLKSQLTGLNLNEFTKKKFHELLFRHNLLPLDLTNEKTRQDYASILQSFSRDSGFKTDSESLKNFLFGHDDQQRFQQQFKEEVESIDREFQEQERFHGEIELIHQKEKALMQVADLNTKYREKERSYLEALNHYWYRKVKQDEKTCETAENSARAIRVEAEVLEAKQGVLEVQELKVLEQLLEKQQLLLKQKRPKVPSDYEQVKQKYDRLLQYQKWLNQHADDPKKVSQWFALERKKAENKDLLNRFEQYLDQNGQREIFTNSAWLTDYVEKQTNYEQDRVATKIKLNQLQALSTFSNIADAESLGAWALSNLKFPVSHEHESVLVHFQKLPRTAPEPKTGERYLPFPKNLFDELKVDKKTKTKVGFWIDLDGVHEFITYVPDRHLNQPSTENIKAILDMVSASVESDLRVLREQKEKDEKLYHTLQQFAAVGEAVALYANSEAVKLQATETTLTLEEFQFHEEAYLQRLKVETNFHQKHKDYEQATKSEKQAADEAQKLVKEIAEHKEYFGFSEINSSQIQSAIRQRSIVISKDDDEEIRMLRKTTESRLFPDEVSLRRVLQMKANLASSKTTAEGTEQTAKTRLEYSRQQQAKSRDSYLLAIQKDWRFDSKHPVVNTSPDEGGQSLKEDYERAKRDFEHQYDVTKAQTDQPEQLEGYSVGLLAHRLLPTVFSSSKFDESLIQQQIAARLTKLAADLQVIGGRKLEILKRVFSEVYRTYQGYLTKVEGINRYFRKKQLGITGGNRASLIYEKSPDYPEKWMTPFRKQLDDYSKEVTDGLFRDLKKEIDIYDMMKKAFQNAGGSPNVSPEELLNPKSYFDLQFEIKDSIGNRNAGSQGQTYTANALLCLARLSLIEEEERPGIRIMPIDEAQGLGSNYDMLHKLAKAEKFQVLSMSIETAGEMKSEGQYVYIMNENNQDDTTTYVPPLGIFSDGVVRDDIDLYITKTLADE